MRWRLSGAAGSSRPDTRRESLPRWRPTGPTGPSIPGFGVGGKVTIGFGNFAIAYAIATRNVRRQRHRRGLGQATPTSPDDVALVRYRADGVLDPTFGTGGSVLTSFGSPSEGRAVALGRHGEIVIAASSPFNTENDDFLLARYRADGTLDPRFGVGGLVTTDFFGGPDHARAVIEQPDGSIVVGGSATGSQQLFSGFGLARYLGHRARGARER